MCLELKKRYDGYHFVENSIGMYNPFSLLNTFAKKKLSDYWFETGTPSYLVELLKRTDYNLYDMAHTQTNAEDKQYALPFTSDTRTLFRIGVNFNNETRNIDTWKIQTT